MSPLAPDVRLWFADPHEIRDPAVLAEYTALLSREERCRHDRFQFERDRHHFLVAHALVRATLGRLTGRDPAALTFTSGERGRPELDLEPGEPRLRFNLSHTRGLVAVAVTRERDVGVDVERLREVNLGVADKHFAPSEVEAMNALPNEDRSHRFFSYWTLKEAYIKARGMGLALPLDGFAFDLDQGDRIGFAVNEALGDRPDAWSFALLDAGTDHRAAFAVRSEPGESVSWSMARAVPCVEEEVIGYPVIASLND